MAFSRSRDGELVVQEIGGGTHVVDRAGPFGTISFSPDGTELAYVDEKRQVFVATLDGEVRAVGGTGCFMPSLQWEVGGWFWYPEGSSARDSTTVVLPGSAGTRQLDADEFVRVAGSPTEPRLAYLDCAEALPQSCVSDLVIERPDGSDRVVLASGIAASGVVFSPDGGRIVVAEQRGDQFRAVARPVDGAGPDVDLGPASGQMYVYGPPPGLSLFSPDGEEILSMDGSALVALRLDGGGARTIADPGPTYAWHAGFTPAGDVLFMQVVNTEQPPDDTPEFAYTTRVVGADGKARTLRALDPECGIALYAPTVATVSADGALIAYDCGIVQRISDGEVIADLAALSRPLGFTPDGGTLFLVGTEILLVGEDGSSRTLGETFGAENQDVEGLQAAYHRP